MPRGTAGGGPRLGHRRGYPAARRGPGGGRGRRLHREAPAAPLRCRPLLVGSQGGCLRRRRRRRGPRRQPGGALRHRHRARHGRLPRGQAPGSGGRQAQGDSAPPGPHRHRALGHRLRPRLRPRGPGHVLGYPHRLSGRHVRSHLPPVSLCGDRGVDQAFRLPAPGSWPAPRLHRRQDCPRRHLRARRTRVALPRHDHVHTRRRHRRQPYLGPARRGPRRHLCFGACGHGGCARGGEFAALD
mmetsp:Transcript_4882/g.14398  ORF Transcript_4882/g.14398 Transcript_4882/m.14398 type:complete len:242 (-) Transcript_4882:632-1357(-)